MNTEEKKKKKVILPRGKLYTQGSAGMFSARSAGYACDKRSQPPKCHISIAAVST